MAKPTISVENLSVAYQGKIALKNISLTIQSEKMTGIIGPNGAGKSTFMKSLLELIPKSSGTVTFSGQSVKEVRKKIAYVEQRSAMDLSFPIDVFGVVLLGTYPSLRIGKRPGKLEKERAAQALVKVGMEKFANRQISELSGGQLQRVFIARALTQGAEWIFLDEPFVGIDAVSEKKIFSILQELRAEGKTILIVHHDLHKVTEYFDEVILLNRELIASGTVQETFTSNNLQLAYGEVIGQLVKGEQA
ncbi:metal ABC transporter ATP-binding protein [Enterococcus thailandicus]|uniref:metal ABC transporter ATP-binding protein n=1 Tax=Enterococcus TaxID=1350 RepID=UPI00244D8F02|nr:metal ABC transporter ATP-binding protein [Enterococcus thailandicus]MDT2750869.1 metal ABC transporter ATP-binding protein [Enterococcus thailandicus]MDT2775804.1 metal ABC transporter ATP-binding protein [Enterococcus thailandicus]MDT2794665.1 metal ABC transporter ATP-binding protein [Enterococcus thailandicus]MDT2845058.1 metal ABC transporter ATP-binding protein [Enterococcus thailandicus]GMC01959.1 manganese transporter [Enterococcus thailandicus]